MDKLYITGSNGFIGQHLVEMLKDKNMIFIVGNRSVYGDFCAQSSWELILKDVTCIVHLAARVHVMNELSTDPLTEFRKMNVEATMNLAKAAKSVGVKRFIYISSVKVNGEETFDLPFKASDSPAPRDPYGVSKMEAEIELLKLHEPGIFEVVIIRPPLVYGPGVKANFEKLFHFVDRDLPIPFGLVKNKRSLVSVYNLCDLIITCIDHPKTSGEVFLVSDDRDLSLKDLIIEMAKTKNKHPHLLLIPVSLMKLGLFMIGKKSVSDRLFGNLQVDITKTKELLNWKPPYTFQDTFK